MAGGYQLAQAYVQIVPSMKGVGKAIEAAFAGPAKSTGTKAGETAGGGFSAGFGAKMGAISGVASSVASKVIDVFSGLSGEIMNASDSTQKFGQTLQFAGVSDSAIKRLTASTQEYANKTVYGIDDIRNTTAQLAANGVPNYDKLAEAAGNLNAVAGGNAETYKSVAMVLTQTAGAGKLTTENWNQLADAIPGASGKLQEAMLKNGAYTGNFRDAMANGEITADEFNQALMQLGMDDVAKKAAESTATFEGAFGNLEATIVDGSANIVNTVKPYITGFVTDLGNGIGTALQWVNDFMGKLMQSQGVQTFANGVKSIAGAVGAIAGPIAGAVGMLLGFSGGVDSAEGAAQRFSDILSIIGGVLQAFGGFVQQNAGWLAPLAAAVMAAYGAFVLWNGAIVLWNGAITAWQNRTKIATVVQAAFNAVMSANPIMLVVMAIAAVVAALVVFFTQTETGRQLWAAFTGFLQSAWQNITNFFQSTWQSITQWFTDAGTNIQNTWNAVTGFVSSIPGRITGFFADIGAWFGQKFDEAKQGIENAFNNAVNWVQGVPGRITGFFAGIGAWFGQKFDEVRNGIADGFNRAVDFVKSIPGRILDALGNLGGLLWDAGASIMQGFLDGLRSIWDNITGFVGDIAGWIADHKGPLPYDRRLLVPAGEAIMGGFRRSLNAGWAKVQSDIDGMNTGLAAWSPAVAYRGMAYSGYEPAASSAANVRITNYYPQADPWPLATNSNLDNLAYGI